MTPLDRTRPAPRERFEHDALRFNLRDVAHELATEHEEYHNGHRQISLYKHDAASISLFRFNTHGFLPPHRALGTVFVQVIEGRITLTVDAEQHTLSAGGLLVLAPGVLHDVKANEDSVMLLTVCMEKR